MENPKDVSILANFAHHFMLINEATRLRKLHPFLKSNND
jgi:hypothetical protein